MTPFWRSREAAVSGLAEPKSNPSRMNAGDPDARAHGRLAVQIPSFVAVGLIGYVVDAGITFVGAKYLGLAPVIARPPGFILATIVNFLLNRSFTFRHSGRAGPAGILPLLRRGLDGACGQLRRLFGLRSAGAELRDRGHARHPAAVRRRRQRRRDGCDLSRISVFRLPALTIVDFSRQRLGRSRYDRKR